MATENAKAIEAIVMVAEQPVEPQLLAQLLEIKVDEVEAILQELMASYEVEDRGFILTKIAGGYRYQSHPDLAPYVERYVLEGQTARLSAAALETLAIIAYKQPISRAQVAAVRGVNVDGVVRTLEQRGYIAEVGRDPGPGNPTLFGTTDVFLEKLGINSVADLPPIAAFVPGPDIVEQLEQGLRAEIDSDLAAELSADAQAAGEQAAGEEDVDGAAGDTGDDVHDPAADTPEPTSPDADPAVTIDPDEPSGDGEPSDVVVEVDEVHVDAAEGESVKVEPDAEVADSGETSTADLVDESPGVDGSGVDPDAADGGSEDEQAAARPDITVGTAGSSEGEVADDVVVNDATFRGASGGVSSEADAAGEEAESGAIEGHRSGGGSANGDAGEGAPADIVVAAQAAQDPEAHAVESAANGDADGGGSDADAGRTSGFVASATGSVGPVDGAVEDHLVEDEPAAGEPDDDFLVEDQPGEGGPDDDLLVEDQPVEGGAAHRGSAEPPPGS